MRTVLVCRCGQAFRKRSDLMLHIVFANPQWPQSTSRQDHGFDTDKRTSGLPKPNEGHYAYEKR